MPGVIAYAESSAILSWLLEEPRAQDVARVLDDATLLIASSITGIECSRTIVRAQARGEITRSTALALLQKFRDAESTWERMELHDAVAERASAPFPVEPIRALDAIHVATAVLAQERFGDVAMLSLDERVRSNAAALGLTVLPART